MTAPAERAPNVRQSEDVFLLSELHSQFRRPILSIDEVALDRSLPCLDPICQGDFFSDLSAFKSVSEWTPIQAESGGWSRPARN